MFRSHRPAPSRAAGRRSIARPETGREAQIGWSSVLGVNGCEGDSLQNCKPHSVLTDISLQHRRLAKAFVASTIAAVLLIELVAHMFGLSSRSEQRKEPTWTQAPSSNNAQAEPVWRDATASSSQSYEPSRVQAGGAEKKSSANRLWVSGVLGVIGLLAVAYLFLRMVDVVEAQMVRNQPQQSSTGLGLMSNPSEGAAVNASGR